MVERKTGDFLFALDGKKTQEEQTIDTNVNDTQHNFWMEKFEEHKGLVGFFIKFHPLSFIEYDDYYQLMLMKYWDLVCKFGWDRYNADTCKDVYIEQRRAFCGYVKKSFERYVIELRKEYSKQGFVHSLDEYATTDDEITFKDLVLDLGISSSKSYCLAKLQEIKNTGYIKGYLIDFINGYNYSQISKRQKCSRGKVKREIQKELDILKKIV